MRPQPIFKIICKRTMNYFYYKDLPKCFMNSKNYFIQEIPLAEFRGYLITNNGIIKKYNLKKN